MIDLPSLLNALNTLLTGVVLAYVVRTEHRLTVVETTLEMNARLRRQLDKRDPD